MHPSRSLFAVLLSFLSLGLGRGAWAQAPAPRRFAILVGINKYADPSLVQLGKAQNDAEELGAALKRMGGYKAVIVMSGSLGYDDANFPSRSKIIERVEATAEIMRPEDQFVFFFSGHGVNDPSGASILLPIDAQLKDPLGTGIDLRRDLVAKFEAAGLRNLVFLVDACQKAVAKDKGLAVVGVNELRGGGQAVVIAATGKGKSSYEDPKGGNGLFTRSLLAALEGEGDLDGDGSVSVSELESYLPDAVAEYALSVGLSQKPSIFDPGTGKGQPALAQLRAPRPSATASAPGAAQASAAQASAAQASAAQASAQFVTFRLPEGVRVDLRLLSPEGRELRTWSDTASFSEKLEPGSYRIEAQDRSCLYYPYSASFAVGDSKLSLPVELKPNFGSLSVSCDPADGVDVIVNGEKRGSLAGGSFSIDRLKSGSYELVLSKELYETRRQGVQIEDGKAARVSATLAPNFFTLSIGVAGALPARLFVDGRDRGALPLTLKLPFQEAALRVAPVDPRYKEWVETLRPSAKGSAERREAVLAQRTGILEATTLPDAEAALTLIPVGGRAAKIGTAPMDYEALIGDYELLGEAIVGGKRLSGSAKLSVREGQTSQVRLELHEAGASAPSDVALGDFVQVPAGTFLMGSPASEPGHAENEGPQHMVTLPAFTIGKCEVTFDEYDAYCEATGAPKPADQGWGRGRRPAVNVSWNDAVQYCNWRSSREGLRPCYAIEWGKVSCDFGANGYRLPTEAEWEYAARGGPAAKGLAANAVYAGSANLDRAGWYSANSASQTHPVGQKAPNALGLYDMAGNAWEWCWDWYDLYYYGKSPAVEPAGPGAGGGRVTRGGCWNGGASLLRSATRSMVPPEARANFLGFRLLRRP